MRQPSEVSVQNIVSPANRSQECSTEDTSEGDSSSESSDDDDDLFNEFADVFGAGGSAYENGDETTQEIKRRRVSASHAETSSVISKGCFAPKSTRLPGLKLIDPLVTKIIRERCAPEGVQTANCDVSHCITVALKVHIGRVVESAVKQRIQKVHPHSDFIVFLLVI